MMRRSLCILLASLISFMIAAWPSEKAEAEEREEKKGPRVVKILQGEITLSGFAQTLFAVDEAAERKNQFSIPRAKLKLSGKVMEEISFFFQFNAATKSSDTTPSGKADTIFRDAWADLAYIPFATVRVGQFKTPFGLEGVEAPNKLLTINRSVATQNLYHERDIGVMIHGKYRGPIGIDFGAAVINGAGRNSSDDNNRKDLIGRIALVIPGTATIGLSGQTGSFLKGVSKNEDRERLAVDVELFPAFSIQNLRMRGEYLRGNPLKDPVDIIRGSQIKITDARNKATGWYILALYRFPRNIEPLIRYEEFDPDRSIGDNRLKITTVGANYYIAGDTKVQVNYEIKDEEGPFQDNNALLVFLQIDF